MREIKKWENGKNRMVVDVVFVVVSDNRLLHLVLSPLSSSFSRFLFLDGEKKIKKNKPFSLSLVHQKKKIMLLLVRCLRRCACSLLLVFSSFLHKATRDTFTYITLTAKKKEANAEKSRVRVETKRTRKILNICNEIGKKCFFPLFIFLLRVAPFVVATWRVKPTNK